MAQIVYTRTGKMLAPFIKGFTLGARTVITAAGTTTFTPNRYAKLVFFQLWGGGGGGKNCANSSAAQIVLGGGGGGGGYSELLYPAVPQGFTIVVGAGGSGTTGAAGTTSTIALVKGVIIPNTTFTAQILSASPGAAGATLATGTSQAFTSSGNLANGSSMTSITIATDVGGVAYRDSGTVAKSGKGGDATCFAGGGGRAIIAHGAGNDATSVGGGGGGAMSVNAAGATNGGNGFQGLCIAWEYY